MNGTLPKKIELDASWASSNLEQFWNAAAPIVLSFLLQTTRSRDNFELIEESDNREGIAMLECALS